MAATQRDIELRQSNEETERRLAQLWDDIHQRQKVLEDIGTCLNSREERAINAQHTLVCNREGQAFAGQWDAWPIGQDVEQLQLEFTAAELADRAWRERSAALVHREEELLARLHLLEDPKPKERLLW